MKRPLLYFLCCVLWLLAVRPPMAQPLSYPLTPAVILDSRRLNIDEISIKVVDQALTDDNLTFRAVTPGIIISPAILFNANSAIPYSRTLTATAGGTSPYICEGEFERLAKPILCI